jgi:hypothetical protein
MSSILTCVPAKETILINMYASEKSVTRVAGRLCVGIIYGLYSVQQKEAGYIRTTWWRH